MAIRSYKPVTPSMRYIKRSTFEEITKTTPEKSLVKTKKKTGGRNSDGHITMRGLGGGAKQKIRNVDFRRRFARNAYGPDATVKGEVVAIEYDPIRSARLALVQYPKGERRYIIASRGLEVGSVIFSGPKAEPEPGNALPLGKIPPGTAIHNIELTMGKGGQIVRAAGSSATLMATDTVQLFHDHVLVKEPATPTATPWHADRPYYFVDGHQTISFWIPLDPVSADTTLRIIAACRWALSAA